MLVCLCVCVCVCVCETVCLCDCMVACLRNELFGQFLVDNNIICKISIFVSLFFLLVAHIAH